MKILLTGHKGYVGSHLRKALFADGHSVLGMEADCSFDQWLGRFSKSKNWDYRLHKLDAVLHVGAISENQSEDPEIYLWNSYGSFVLAKFIKERYGDRIPFIFFSTYLVESTENDWGARSAYTWSKVQAEQYIQTELRQATILRPGTMWGEETKKNPLYRTVPYQLATHSLKKLYKNWGRNYVHVSDVIRAVKNCLVHRHQGIYSMAGDAVWMNEQLAELVKWDGYEWMDSDLKYKNSHLDEVKTPRLPGWTPIVQMKTELPLAEMRCRNDRKCNGAEFAASD